MATVVLSAAGAAIGGSIGGTVAGLGAAAIGRAVGATVGRVIDQKLLGQGSDAVEQGKIDRFRLSNASEGAAIAQVYGRVRLGGQIIWASDFLETSQTSGGGKGAPAQPQTTTYSYSVSLAVALCEGEILGVVRIWADGTEISADELSLRIYTGTRDQLPDPKIEAIEGPGAVPGYRGTAYVVIEDLDLGRFGNRVPQFTFEVLRAEQPDQENASAEIARGVSAVALMPGTGEYALATTPVHYGGGTQAYSSANINSPSGKPDLLTSLDGISAELPNCEAVSLIVSWFGGDLRCGTCELQPKVEQAENDGGNMPWSVSGLTRAQAVEIAQQDGRPIYGGSPADASVVEAILGIKASGRSVMFYPFILMDQLEGNELPDPYTGEVGQPALPWRGRITLSTAPNRAGSPDGTASADEEVNAFFGSVTAEDFSVGDGMVDYSGPDEWSLTRFILHYAALCASAGGVEAFCISSEMRGLTQIRGEGGRFVAVERLKLLTAEVRKLVGPDTKISYAADWSEYFGYQPQDGSGDRYFHLDPLWADTNIDFIGIDNYMPLSDWRDGPEHLDADANGIYDEAYLASNIEGGEGYDWFYETDEARASQIRTPITDEAHNEPWIWRYKDLRNWWINPHHERVGGVRQTRPTAWVPQSKPFWFTEYGCAAIDKGTNQPNKFLDPKSSESRLPFFSTGARDDLIQKQYYKAMLMYWRDPAKNPTSELYGGAMLDMDRAFAWAWDARPFPFFPNNIDLWSDGENYGRGHWINGRAAARSLQSVVSEICARSGVEAFDTSMLHGIVRGYSVDRVEDGRAALQPLMLRYGFDAIDRDGILTFRMREQTGSTAIDTETMVDSFEIDGILELSRESEAELSGRIRYQFIEAEGDYTIVAEEAILPDEATNRVATSESALVLTRSEGRQVAERWLTEARVARERVRFALPVSRLDIGAGDVVRIPVAGTEQSALYRIEQAEYADYVTLEGVRVDPSAYAPSLATEERPRLRDFVPPVPLTALFMDLPLITGDEVPHAPHLAVGGRPWPGSAAVYVSESDSAFALSNTLERRSIIGWTRTDLAPARAGVLDRGPALEVELFSGALQSISESALLSGRNLAAIGDGSPDNWEVFQFERAELIAPRRYLLSSRLRGQIGTEFLASQPWPVGSWVVLLDGAPEQIDVPRNLRRISRNYRIGPAGRSPDDPSFIGFDLAFNGNGLRPLAPVHLRAWRTEMGLTANWVRRTRLDGDSWESRDVPVGEESETYLLRILQDGTLVYETEVSQPSWTSDQTISSLLDTPGLVQVQVAQLSSSFGPGPFASARLNMPGAS